MESLMHSSEIIILSASILIPLVALGLIAFFHEVPE